MFIHDCYIHTHPTPTIKFALKYLVNKRYAGVSKWNQINYTSNVNAVTEKAFIRNLIRESQGYFAYPRLYLIDLATKSED